MYSFFILLKHYFFSKCVAFCGMGPIISYQFISLTCSVWIYECGLISPRLNQFNEANIVSVRNAHLSFCVCTACAFSFYIQYEAVWVMKCFKSSVREIEVFCFSQSLPVDESPHRLNYEGFVISVSCLITLFPGRWFRADLWLTHRRQHYIHMPTARRHNLHKLQCDITLSSWCFCLGYYINHFFSSRDQCCDQKIHSTKIVY